SLTLEGEWRGTVVPSLRHTSEVVNDARELVEGRVNLLATLLRSAPELPGVYTGERRPRERRREDHVLGVGDRVAATEEGGQVGALGTGEHGPLPRALPA